MKHIKHILETLFQLVQHSDLLLQHQYKTLATYLETLETDACKWFQRNISLLPRRMEACRRVEFTGVELAGGMEIDAPIEKGATSLHTMRVERELCAG